MRAHSASGIPIWKWWREHSGDSLRGSELVFHVLSMNKIQIEIGCARPDPVRVDSACGVPIAKWWREHSADSLRETGLLSHGVSITNWLRWARSSARGQRQWRPDQETVVGTQEWLRWARSSARGQRQWRPDQETVAGTQWCKVRGVKRDSGAGPPFSSNKRMGGRRGRSLAPRRPFCGSALFQLKCRSASIFPSQRVCRTCPIQSGLIIYDIKK